MRNLLLLLLLPLFTQAQRIAKVYNHDITGQKVYESTTERWVRQGVNASSTFVLRRIGDTYELEVKFIPVMTGAGALYTVQLTDSLIINTSGGGRIAVPPVKVTNSCVGCGMFDTYGEYMHGTTTHHILLPDHVALLLKEDVLSIGLQSSFKYVEQEVGRNNRPSLRILLGYVVTY